MNNKLNKFLKCFAVCGITGLLAFTTLAIVNNTVNQNQYKTAKADTITDLTNTTWVLNNTFTHTVNGLTFSQLDDAYEDYNLTFTSNNITYTTFLFCGTGYAGTGIQYIYNGIQSNQRVVWDYSTQSWKDEAYRTISITAGTGVNNSTLITWLQSNATQQTGGGSEPGEPTDTPVLETFTFLETFNFNAPVNMASSVQKFLKGDYTTSDSYLYELNLPRFVVNGVEYDTIKIEYHNANGLQFKNVESTTSGTITSYPLVNNNNYVFYLYMWFADSTQTGVFFDNLNAVNTRVRSTYTDVNGDEHSYITPNTHWRSPNFRTLSFIEELTDEQRSLLNAFNNNIYGINETYTNTHLVNVFSLFTLAFSSWLTLLNMQIVPGISLGMMMFMPLIVGIILTIIWLVKR